MDINLSRKEIYGMQSDRIDNSAFVDKVHEIFVTTFGEDMCLNKRAEAFDHMNNLHGIVKHENITRRMENIENALIL